MDFVENPSTCVGWFNLLGAWTMVDEDATCCGEVDDLKFLFDYETSTCFFK
jgi:hypothetical protein